MSNLSRRFPIQRVNLFATKTLEQEWPVIGRKPKPSAPKISHGAANAVCISHFFYLVIADPHARNSGLPQVEIEKLAVMRPSPIIGSRKIKRRRPSVCGEIEELRLPR